MYRKIYKKEEIDSQCKKHKDEKKITIRVDQPKI